MPKFRSVHGSRYAFLNSGWIPEDATAETALLRRWRIVQTPLFAVYLHRHIRPDRQGLHDHPYSFVSVILKGGYTEERLAAKPLTHFALSARYMKAEWPHRIESLLRVPTWTLLLVGRRRRAWGRYTDHGWQRYEVPES